MPTNNCKTVVFQREPVFPSATSHNQRSHIFYFALCIDRLSCQLCSQHENISTVICQKKVNYHRQQKYTFNSKCLRMLLEGLSRNLIKYWGKVSFLVFCQIWSVCVPKNCNSIMVSLCYHQGPLLQLGIEWEIRMWNQFYVLFVYVMKTVWGYCQKIKKKTKKPTHSVALE